MLDMIIGVEKAAELLGLTPGTVKNYCSEGKLKATKVGNTWILDKSNLKVNEKRKRELKGLNDLFLNGRRLTSMTSASSDVDNKNRYSAHFREVNPSPSDDVNHYKVTWDLTYFLTAEAQREFEWGKPHFLSVDEDPETTVNYFSKFVPYDLEISMGGKDFKIINRPVSLSSGVEYWAGAIDGDGNPYKLFWNVVNMIDPYRIEMINDQRLYCHRCLKPWASQGNKCVDEDGHEYKINKTED
ncbi:excisionase family DNA binding protein [Pullulanibacillus pueri]|uniref:Helix-turn-helix domain-containing protein n=1 Tax=Pullulanibacillus pueri TaxID=1437324 RepID=A0A8J2ZWL8_9BACL|nr:helix-turn-helix domain-containing protein [Pullulanibacillus pueri]MBM7681928.1 excisionase family DNA binding protein [Pullulanibacillus pueri]GGH83480.1 hypothetical protein GCM10007096_24410 [Pullulanibacillus pueri]